MAAKKRNPKISIIIPSFQKGKYLEKTLQSLISQHYDNLEIIIQDGGSTDNSIEIIKKYAKKNKSIIWESKKDKGQTDAINKGLKKAKGEILSYINADDVLTKDALNEIAKAYEVNKNALWFTGFGNIINEDDQQISHYVTNYKNWLIKKNNRNYLLAVNYLTQPATFFSKKAYQKHGPFDSVGRIVMEYGFWLRLSKKEMPVIIPKPLASFRLTKDNLSATAFKKILAEDVRLMKKETNNPFIIATHVLNNYARIILINLI